MSETYIITLENGMELIGSYDLTTDMFFDVALIQFTHSEGGMRAEFAPWPMLAKPGEKFKIPFAYFLTRPQSDILKMYNARFGKIQVVSKNILLD